MNASALIRFIEERERIRVKKEAGEPWPWTADPVLQTYRFCNVRRNDDRETRLIHANWLHPLSDHEDVWFAMVVARLVNWWPTLAELGPPLPWNPRSFVKLMDSRKERGEKVFTGAYMVRADAVVGGTKAAYLAEYVLTPMWGARSAVRPRAGDTLEAFHRRLTQWRDMGNFMSAQVVADVKYAQGSPLRHANDWWTWAASGPGSLRGLNRLQGIAKDTPWREQAWRKAFEALRAEVVPYLIQYTRVGRITGQDLQNCLCEYDKYMRVRLGEGRPRALYHQPKEK